MTHRDSCPAGPLGPLFGECNCPLEHEERPQPEPTCKDSIPKDDSSSEQRTR